MKNVRSTASEEQSQVRASIERQRVQRSRSNRSRVSDEQRNKDS